MGAPGPAVISSLSPSSSSIDIGGAGLSTLVTPLRPVTASLFNSPQARRPTKAAISTTPTTAPATLILAPLRADSNSNSTRCSQRQSESFHHVPAELGAEALVLVLEVDENVVQAIGCLRDRPAPISRYP